MTSSGHAGKRLGQDITRRDRLTAPGTTELAGARGPTLSCGWGAVILCIFGVRRLVAAFFFCRSLPRIAGPHARHHGMKSKAVTSRRTPSLGCGPAALRGGLPGLIDQIDELRGRPVARAERRAASQGAVRRRVAARAPRSSAPTERWASTTSSGWAGPSRPVAAGTRSSAAGKRHRAACRTGTGSHFAGFRHPGFRWVVSGTALSRRWRSEPAANAVPLTHCDANLGLEPALAP